MKLALLDWFFGANKQIAFKSAIFSGFRTGGVEYGTENWSSAPVLMVQWWF
jgi:hypothetical protein